MPPQRLQKTRLMGYRPYCVQYDNTSRGTALLSVAEVK